MSVKEECELDLLKVQNVAREKELKVKKELAEERLKAKTLDKELFSQTFKGKLLKDLGEAVNKGLDNLHKEINKDRGKKKTTSSTPRSKVIKIYLT